jgi:enoyl-CoA hydratase
MAGRITAEKHGSVGWITFDNPAKHNAVSYEMWSALPDAIAGMVAEPDVRVLVLRGAGDRAFVSGADISQFETMRASQQAVDAYDKAAEKANTAISSCIKPTIAMINGYCFGGGVGVALCCDLRFAADNARFAIPAAKLGLGYAYAGVKRLVDLVGPAYAREIFYTARSFEADEALTMGLVNRVTAAANLMHLVETTAELIAQNAPLTIAAAKQAVASACADENDKRLPEVAQAIKACFASEDYKEGRRAFIDKRPPRFVGR